MGQSDEFREYCNIAARLQCLEPENFSEDKVQNNVFSCTNYKPFITAEGVLSQYLQLSHNSCNGPPVRQWLNTRVSHEGSMSLMQDSSIVFTLNIFFLLKVPGFWKIHAYNIGGCVYNLDEIEHGVLRANKGKRVVEIF